MRIWIMRNRVNIEIYTYLCVIYICSGVRTRYFGYLMIEHTNIQQNHILPINE